MVDKKDKLVNKLYATMTVKPLQWTYTKERKGGSTCDVLTLGEVEVYSDSTDLALIYKGKAIKLSRPQLEIIQKAVHRNIAARLEDDSSACDILIDEIESILNG